MPFFGSVFSGCSEHPATSMDSFRILEGSFEDPTGFFARPALSVDGLRIPNVLEGILSGFSEHPAKSVDSLDPFRDPLRVFGADD